MEVNSWGHEVREMALMPSYAFNGWSWKWEQFWVWSWGVFVIK